MNAIALYVGSGIMADLLGLIKVSAADGTKVPAQSWIFENWFASWASPVNASLAYAIAFVLVWLILMWILYRAKVIIRI